MSTIKVSYSDYLDRNQQKEYMFPNEIETNAATILHPTISVNADDLKYQLSMLESNLSVTEPTNARKPAIKTSNLGEKTTGES